MSHPNIVPQSSTGLEYLAACGGISIYCIIKVYWMSILRRQQRLSCHERRCITTRDRTPLGHCDESASSPRIYPSFPPSAPPGEREKHCLVEIYPDPKIGVRSRGRANRPDTICNHVRKPTRRWVRPPE